MASRRTFIALRLSLSGLSDLPPVSGIRTAQTPVCCWSAAVLNRLDRQILLSLQAKRPILFRVSAFSAESSDIPILLDTLRRPFRKRNASLPEKRPRSHKQCLTDKSEKPDLSRRCMVSHIFRFLIISYPSTTVPHLLSGWYALPSVTLVNGLITLI